MNKLKKGFTLIELLVVIAIIGILSSVVLASLNTARTKGSDSAVKSAMASLRSQAAIYYDVGQNYGATAFNGTCASAVGSSNVFGSSTAIIANINANAGGAAWCKTIGSPSTSFIVTVPLKGGELRCVDANNSVSTTTAMATSSATACQ